MTDSPFETVAQTLAASGDFAKALADGKVKLDMGYEVLDDYAADEDNTQPYLRVTPVTALPPSLPPVIRSSAPWAWIWFCAFFVSLLVWQAAHWTVHG